ncbi:MAG TPA: sigma-54 dependent transcriptional regulator [Longimicrobiales bacterium]|nr:sigma-54 dependent transcriptional regulator [Longimicrobiales bacterium]
MPSLLIADDQPDVIQALRLLLKGEGFLLQTAASPEEILEAVSKKDFDAVLMDLNYARDTTSGREGLDVLSKLRALDHTLPIIVMTAWGSVEGAVEAMRLGARDYIEKPWDNARLLSMLRTQIELAKTTREKQSLEGENRRLRKQNLPEFVANSRGMQPVVRMMERVGPSDANVLVMGEHGTGKEVVARWLHASSRRSERPLIAVNAGGFSETLFESELFGHVKGAFTDAKTDRVGCFEMADGGTLFLDEIANITPKQQAKLLRVLESGEVQRVGSSKTRHVDVRVISATNANLDRAIAEGVFREDLLYRLNTVEVRLPPLRERREDIPVLAARFLQRRAEHYDKVITGFERGAMQALLDHPWPGNVRELEHVVERAVLMARGSTVQESDLNLRLPADTLDRLDKMTLDDAERLLIQKALDRSDGNVSRAADALGLSRSALYRRLQKYEL